ncbi:MAG TPA: PH domain-containing protein [Longimicrobiales bacterium]
MTLSQRLLRFLRVPHAPSAPAGDADVAVFRAAPNYFYYRIIRWAASNVGALAGLLVGLSFITRIPTAGFSRLTTIFWVLEAFAIGAFIVQAAARLALLRIDIDQRWYLVSDRSLRIREGIINLKEKTMTFANIQNVRIEQGPLQRMLGIADVQVRTAGGGGKASNEEEHGGGGKDMHIGYFRGVANPSAIRDAVLERLRQHADSGLGDPDDASDHPDSPPDSLMEAARALAVEAAALRQAAGLISAPVSGTQLPRR